MLSFIVLMVTSAALYRRQRVLLPSVAALATFAIMAAPYAAGLSWYFGHFTMGESGTLNYAFHINYLPHWTNWQGGPAGYGTPIHPTHEVLKHPDLFVFGEPFHTTYPPFGNITYWYQGYRHFWSAKYQAIGIARNLFYLVKILVGHPIFYAAFASLCLFLLQADMRLGMIRQMRRLWPFYLSAALGIALYATVHLEDRYLGSFLATLCVLPFVAAATMPGFPSRKTRQGALFAMALGTVLNLAIVDRDVLSHIRHHYTNVQNPQWKLGLYVRNAGFKPGDEMAVVGGPNASCTWAYIAHTRVVAELGGDPFDPHQPDKQGIGETMGKEPQIFWGDSLEERQKILTAFKQAGAVAVIAPSKPANADAAGWQHVDGTDFWIRRL
jgi:hypothetical protein